MSLGLGSTPSDRMAKPHSELGPSRRKRYGWEPNDGRAPDTRHLMAIADEEGNVLKIFHDKKTLPPSAHSSKSTQQSKTKGHKQRSKTVTPPLHLRQLQSYTWSNNSCFFDPVLELLYRSYDSMLPSLRSKIDEAIQTKAAPGGDGIGVIFDHFRKRQDWVTGSKHDKTLAIDIGQGHARTWAHGAWQVCPRGTFGDASVFLSELITTANRKQVPKVGCCGNS